MQERNATTRANLGDLLDLPVTAATEFADWHRDAPPNVFKPGADSGAPSGVGAAAGAASQQLSEPEIRYLRAVVNNAGQASSTYPKLAQMGSRRALKIRARLCDLGYLREHKVATGSRGRSAIVLEPLEPARAVVRDDGPAKDSEVTA